MSGGTNQSRVVRYNRAAVLDTVRHAPDGVSRAAIASATGLTAQTVSNLVTRLVDDGLVREHGAETGTRGAPGRLLRLVPTGASAVGVHLDPARVTVVLLDLEGSVTALTTIEDADPADPVATIDAMAAATRALVDGAGVVSDRVLGIGVASPGPIDAAGTRLVAPPQLARWRGVAVAEELAARTGMPVRVEKDAVAGAIGERWTTVDPADDLVFLYLGHGVSAGIVTGGRVVRGATGNAGEIGGVVVRAHGRWGELWRACQPQAQVRRAADAGIGAPVDPDDARAVRAAYAALVATDAGRALVTQGGTAIGSALAHVVELVDVPRVVLGGGVALASGVPLVDAVRNRLEARLASPPVVASTRFGEDGVARGAACSVLEAALTPGSDGLALGER
jgi:predicted NBD/HSP70 family sugar kinase